jgi:hypothetical protein
MRIDHSQLAEDSSALKREKAAAPSNGARQKRALAISSSLFGSTSPTGSREERALKDLAFFGECYLNVLLPPYYRLSAAARLVAAPSSRQSARQARHRKQVRPVAVGGIERGLFCATAVKQAAPHFAAWLGPHQVAVGVSASAEKLAFGIAQGGARRPPGPLRSLETGPQERLQRVLPNPSDTARCRSAAPYPAPPALCLRHPGAQRTTRHRRHPAWADFASVEGTQQGCPLGPALFCMWFKPHLDWRIGALRARKGARGPR